MFKKILGFAGKKAFDTISNFKPNVGNLKKNQDTMGKLKKITDTYVVKAGKVDPGLKKALRDSGSKSLQKTDKILRKNKKDGGRIGRKLGGGADMAKRKTNVQKIKETFAPKKPGNVPSKFKGFSKLPEAVQQKMNKKLARKV